MSTSGSLIACLRGLVPLETQGVRTLLEIEAETQSLTNQLLEQHEASNSAVSTAAALPTFFRPKPKPNSLGALMKQLTWHRRELIKSESILTDGMLRHIWDLLEEHAVNDPDNLSINYDNFTQVGAQARETIGKAVDGYFRPSVFAQFAQDGDGCISVTTFTDYLRARSHMHGLRLQLSALDVGDTGVLTGAQLEEFLRQSAMEMPALAEIETSFLSDYSRIAVRKFLFFHGKNGGVRIRDLLNTPFMQDLMDLRSPELADPFNAPSLMANWFSLQSTRRVYNTFLVLDEDSNGWLSKAEFGQISNGSMSPLFIQRIFEEHVMKQRGPLSRGARDDNGAKRKDEMDLVAFTDFVLAWDHRSHPAAIKYFYPIMDLQNMGVLTPADLYTFFREIHGMWVRMGEYADLSIHDVVDELIDMVKPARAPLITAEDLARCGQSGVFFSCLSDVKQFYEYNFRENNMHQDESS